MNPFVTFTEAHGKRIYSVETAAGTVHFIADRMYDNVSDAGRSIKGVNPVVAAMIEEELTVSHPVELKE